MNNKRIIYEKKFIDSVRIMASSLSNLVENLAERLHKGKYKDCKFYLNYMRAKDGLLVFKCVRYKKN